MKRNKAIEHVSETSLTNDGMLYADLFISVRSDKTRQSIVDADSNTINHLYSIMRGRRDNALIDASRKFSFIDYNYPLFSNSQRQTINMLREKLITTLVPLPVSQALVDMYFEFFLEIIDFIDSIRPALEDSRSQTHG